jgi:hypothetical protein
LDMGLNNDKWVHYCYLAKWVGFEPFYKVELVKFNLYSHQISD